MGLRVLHQVQFVTACVFRFRLQVLSLTLSVTLPEAVRREIDFDPAREGALARIRTTDDYDLAVTLRMNFPDAGQRLVVLLWGRLKTIAWIESCAAASWCASATHCRSCRQTPCVVRRAQAIVGARGLVPVSPLIVRLRVRCRPDQHGLGTVRTGVGAAERSVHRLGDGDRVGREGVARLRDITAVAVLGPVHRDAGGHAEQVEAGARPGGRHWSRC